MNSNFTLFKKYRKDASFFFLSNYEKIQLNKICKLVLFLDTLHAIPATSSNFSLRTSEKNSFLISKSGIHKRDLNPSRFVRVNLNGHPISALSPKPSDETLLHALIYRSFPKVNVVAHCHGREFEKFKAPAHVFPGCEILKAFGFKSHQEDFTLPVFENSQDMEALAKEVEPCLEKNKIAFMLEKHGIYCFGNSVEQVQNYLEVFFHLAV
jgi:methylthioribulose-1-phosphate dehydratase